GSGMSAARRPNPPRQARSVARLAAVQALYQMELAGAGADTVVREFSDHRFGGDLEGAAAADAPMAEADEAFFAEVVRGVVADDAAGIPSRPGFDLVVTKDAVVEGVHFLPDDPPDLVARKLLRVNLSDLAAKGAEPDGYFLAVAWPQAWGEAERAGFAAGL